MACIWVIFVVIFLWTIFYAVVKGSVNSQMKRKNVWKPTNQRVYHTPSTATTNRSARQNDILSRAKQNVEEVANDDEFMQEKAARRERLQEELRQRKAAEGTGEAQTAENRNCWEPMHEHDRIQENVQEILYDSYANMDEYTCIPSSESMKKVEDLMVKGYEVNLSNQRDFLAEGMDMLTSYESKK